jgi:hypothetical protein
MKKVILTVDVGHLGIQSLAEVSAFATAIGAAATEIRSMPLEVQTWNTNLQVAQIMMQVGAINFCLRVEESGGINKP